MDVPATVFADRVFCAWCLPPTRDGACARVAPPEYKNIRAESLCYDTLIQTACSNLECYKSAALNKHLLIIARAIGQIQDNCAAPSPLAREVTFYVSPSTRSFLFAVTNARAQFRARRSPFPSALITACEEYSSGSWLKVKAPFCFKCRNAKVQFVSSGELGGVVF